MLHTLALSLRILVVLAFTVYAIRRRSLTAWIFASMIIGIELGMDAPHVALKTRVLADIFLRLIKTIVAPLILTTLISGIAGHGNLKDVGRLGLKTILYFEFVTTFALAIGLIAINISKAGIGVGTPEQTHAVAAASGSAIPTATSAISWSQTLLHLFPENLAKSIAEGQVIQVVIFALLFGIALSGMAEPQRSTVLHFVDAVGVVMFRFTNFVMLFAPVGVGAAMASTVGQMGVGFLLNCGRLLLTLYGALLVFMFLVLLPLSLIARVPIRRFCKAVLEPATIAFATSSSEAALPTAMESMEQLGVSRRIVAFVIPTGYSFNLTGSTLYLTLATVFTAQAAGIHLAIGQQLFILLVLMIASKGVAGVARGTFIVLMATLPGFGLPVWPLMLIFGIDVLMDMGRTVTNLIGNCQAAVVMAIWEKEFHLSPETTPATIE